MATTQGLQGVWEPEPCMCSARRQMETAVVVGLYSRADGCYRFYTPQQSVTVGYSRLWMVVRTRLAVAV